MALPPGCNNNDIDGGRYRRQLDQVETAFCSGCDRQFEVGDVAIVPSVDPDLKWCDDCRKPCPEGCGHIVGVHSVYPTLECDGNGEPDDCHCKWHRPVNVPEAIVTAAKAIPLGIWMSERFRQELRRGR